MEHSFEFLTFFIVRNEGCKTSWVFCSILYICFVLRFAKSKPPFVKNNKDKNRRRKKTEIQTVRKTIGCVCKRTSANAIFVTLKFILLFKFEFTPPRSYFHALITSYFPHNGNCSQTSLFFILSSFELLFFWQKKKRLALLIY
jgi:hypothetical protein